MMSDYLECALNALETCGKGNSKTQLLHQISYAIGQIKLHQVTESHKHDSIIDKMFFVESPDFEGMAEVIRVNDNDTVDVRSDWSGTIYTVDKDDLTEATE